MWQFQRLTLIVLVTKMSAAKHLTELAKVTQCNNVKDVLTVVAIATRAIMRGHDIL